MARARSPASAVFFLPPRTWRCMPRYTLSFFLLYCCTHQGQVSSPIPLGKLSQLLDLNSFMKLLSQIKRNLQFSLLWLTPFCRSSREVPWNVRLWNFLMDLLVLLGFRCFYVCYSQWSWDPKAHRMCIPTTIDALLNILFFNLKQVRNIWEERASFEIPLSLCL